MGIGAPVDTMSLQARNQISNKETAMATEVFRSTPEPEDKLAHFSLLEALLARRSRRFAKGMRLNGGRWPMKVRMSQLR